MRVDVKRSRGKRSTSMKRTRNLSSARRFLPVGIGRDVRFLQEFIRQTIEVEIARGGKINMGIWPMQL